MRWFSSVLVVGAVVLAGATAGADGEHDHTSTSAHAQCQEQQYATRHPKRCAGHVTAAVARPIPVGENGLLDMEQVDLSGVTGVTPTQQRAAENLLRSTIAVLPRWSNYDRALADGFQSIGDGLTGEEHVIHWDWIDDTVILDPQQPESLVYKVDRETGERTLEAAMFIMPSQYTLANDPYIASPMVQFHIHDNLCFTPPPAPQVRGLTQPDGTCRAPLTKFNPNSMVHVWIRPNECGPFAALQGVGAGQTQSGERNCDHDHGRVGL